MSHQNIRVTLGIRRPSLVPKYFQLGSDQDRHEEEIAYFFPLITDLHPIN